MLSTDATTLLGTVMEVTMFSEPSLPSHIMFESSTATEESTSADLPSSPHPVLFSDVSETQDDVPSLGELFFNLKCKVFIYFLS